MKIRLLKSDELDQFILDTQEAFQIGYERYFGKCKDTIIPRKDIIKSYTTEGAKTYVIEEDNQILGGAIVVIDTKTNINDLDILYVKVGCQNGGVGYTLWSEIEKLYPDTLIWHTCTPYFDQRNINFYVNKCKFHIVEYLNKYHNPNQDEDFIGDNGEGMFEFEKVMKKN